MGTNSREILALEVCLEMTDIVDLQRVAGVEVLMTHLTLTEVKHSFTGELGRSSDLTPAFFFADCDRHTHSAIVKVIYGNILNVSHLQLQEGSRLA